MSCDLCNCIGWKVIERGGTSGVDRCECRNCAPASEGQAPLDVQNGAALTKILFDQFSFAGPVPAARSAIARDILELCGTLEAREFLVRTWRSSGRCDAGKTWQSQSRVERFVAMSIWFF